MESNINKYNAFFESVNRFAIITGLSESGDNEGASIQEITDFEHIQKVKFPPVFKSYLTFFGKKVNIRATGFDLDLDFINLEKTIFEANKHQKYYNRKTILDLIRENNYLVNDDYEAEAHPPILALVKPDDLTFFHWDSDRQSFRFFDHTKENPVVFYFSEYERIGTNYKRFTDYIRVKLFTAISNNADTEFTEIYSAFKDRNHTPPHPLRCNVNWLMEYIYIYKYKIIDRALISDFRDEYYKLDRQREQIENRILTIDEFETGFLNYLREKGLKF